jgi:hypothetical protein
MEQENVNIVIKQKRGRKPKNKDIAVELNESNELENLIQIEKVTPEEQKPKKRGRKPKGGKIVQQSAFVEKKEEEKANIILHLKCSLEDLEKNKHIDNSLNSFSFQHDNDLQLHLIKGITNVNEFSDNKSLFINVTKNTNEIIENTYEDNCYANESKNNKDMKLIWSKLKELQKNLHINNIDDKKSACFWCTYDFDNPPIYIPKHYIKNSYHVYGCFCSPECATAYLMKENLDSSTRFERYYLLNFIYSKIYDYTSSIKPAPNPEYMLDKFYGNLTIQEYRSLFKNDRLFLVVDKPLTRILPELHEDNDDFIISNKSIPSNNYQIKKNSKKEIKKEILNKTFGLSS